MGSVAVVVPTGGTAVILVASSTYTCEGDVTDHVEIRMVEVDPGIYDGNINVNRVSSRGGRVKIDLDAIYACGSALRVEDINLIGNDVTDSCIVLDLIQACVRDEGREAFKGCCIGVAEPQPMSLGKLLGHCSRVSDIVGEGYDIAIGNSVVPPCAECRGGYQGSQQRRDSYYGE